MASIKRGHISSAIVLATFVMFYMSTSSTSVAFARPVYLIAAALLAIVLFLRRALVHDKYFTPATPIDMAVEYVSVWALTGIAGWVLALNSELVLVMLVLTSVAFALTLWVRIRVRVVHRVVLVGMYQAILVVIVICVLSAWGGM
jgi:hypothetical protein